MNAAEKLRNDIGFVKWFLLDLMDDPTLNSDEILIMAEILRKLEKQRLQWELLGFDQLGNSNSFHALKTCQN